MCYFWPLSLFWKMKDFLLSALACIRSIQVWKLFWQSFYDLTLLSAASALPPQFQISSKTPNSENPWFPSELIHPCNLPSSTFSSPHVSPPFSYLVNGKFFVFFVTSKNYSGNVSSWHTQRQIQCTDTQIQKYKLN